MKRERSFPRTQTKSNRPSLVAGLRCEIKYRPHGANVHRFPKNVLIRNLFAVDVNLPSPGGIIVQHSAQERNGSPHFLFFGKFLRVLSFALRISKIIREQAAPSSFKKIPPAPWPSRKADVKRSFFPHSSPVMISLGDAVKPRLRARLLALPSGRTLKGIPLSMSSRPTFPTVPSPPAASTRSAGFFGTS